MTTLNMRKKLLFDEKVEVRSVEDGFLGSWHAGKIIGCEDSARVVQYDHLLDDEGYHNLIDRIKVSPIVDGAASGEIVMSDNYRGLIRPFPSPDLWGPWSPHYGQCVEFFYEDAWWEGVIIDHEDGCENRRIFFPDMGDEMVARIDTLRESREWDEITDEWKPRGNWFFLELIEEVEKDWPLPVSVKQIWYEVRLKSGFEKLSEWTSSGRYIWKELVLKVLCDNIRITVKQLFIELKELGQPLEFSEPALDVILKTEGCFRNSLADLPFKAALQCDNERIFPTDQDSISNMLTHEQAVSISRVALPNKSHYLNEDSLVGSDGYKKAPDASSKFPTQKKRLDWKPFVPKMVSGVEFCPNAIDECTKIYRLKRRPPHAVRLHAKKHILHLGWKIEYVRDKAMLRLRYFSPDGELFDSLRKVCMKFDRASQESGLEFSMLMSPTIGIKRSPVSVHDETHSPLLAGKSRAFSKLSKLCTPNNLVIEPDYCPDAVRGYLLCKSNRNFEPDGLTMGAKLRALNAKKHLSAVGWSFYYHMKGGKKEMLYISPSGKSFYSLVSACKSCIEASELNSSGLSRTIKRMAYFDDHSTVNNLNLPLFALESRGKFHLVNGKTLNLSNESSDISLPRGLIPSVEDDAYKTKKSRKKRKHDKTRGSLKLRSMNADSSIPVRRSSKRVRERIASSSQQTPRTVLSWLIDNNVVLPRARVYYRNRNTGPLLAEGRLAREGIKCGCCGGIFTLCKFEVHVGNTSRIPAAHIFLEDGRSLLECQLQLKKQKSYKLLRSESREKKGRPCHKKNDYICSICHYGGKLILCDQCPSSFHPECVGLKEVPEGDWYCRSCCCRICGQSRFDEINGQDKCSSLLACGQCEQRYHDVCVRNKGIISRHREGYWFCGDACEQVFCGLRKILGKPLPLGTENFTWTLMKYTKSESYDHHDACDDECFVEDYSKLNVALSVMHECFEPVKEPGTMRDLVEDVIFNRRSELNRLNFQGFYTVLLEKNDELISAATVRIYGKRVAEVPLVATRFKYRRLGMCRILMDELEKKLTELGVESLVLPAVTGVLNTWTTSFGFSVMDESDRLKFMGYTFLYFPGTIFCQKALTNNPFAVASCLWAGTQAKGCDHVDENVSIELHGSSTASKDFQGEVACVAAVANYEKGNRAARLAIVDDQSIPADSSPFYTKISLGCGPLGINDNNKQAENNNGVMKCYKRRRLPAC